MGRRKSVLKGVMTAGRRRGAPPPKNEVAAQAWGVVSFRSVGPNGPGYYLGCIMPSKPEAETQKGIAGLAASLTYSHSFLVQAEGWRAAPKKGISKPRSVWLLWRPVNDVREFRLKLLSSEAEASGEAGWEAACLCKNYRPEAPA